MRQPLHAMIREARRREDRVGLDAGTTPAADLGAEIVRLARLATAMHMAEAARRRAVERPEPAPTETEPRP